MDDWDDLKYILAVGRQGGLSPAARSLGVNHSTVSRRIAAAETRYGTRLFDRTPQGLVPTAAGRQVIESAQTIEDQVLALGRRVSARDEALEGPLRVTAPQLIIQFHLAEVLAAFARQHPRIALTVSAANEILNLHRREADIAVRVHDAPEPVLYGRVVARQKRTFYAARDFLARHGEAMAAPYHTAPIDCISFTWWGDKPPEEVRRRFPNARTSIALDDMIAVQGAARAGMGIARMPCFVGDLDPALKRVPGFGLDPYLDIWVLTHPDLKNVQKIRRFMQFAADSFGERADDFLGKGRGGERGLERAKGIEPSS